MSQRVKRPNRSDDGSVPVKRRKRTAAEEEEAASLAAAQAAQGAWQPRSNDLKTIYNRTTTEAPAELFRKDLISAMKLPDSEPLAQDEYWVIVDQWKQEWERGVQVPVNPDSLPEPSVSVVKNRTFKVHKDFRLPKNKYIRITKDENFDVEEHSFSNAPAQAEAACSYDLDECDVAWLKILNAERAACGLTHIYEDQLERVIERLELCCWDKIQSILRNEEGLGIEYDENVICDVCRSPDSEDGNEMVFCDSCNICVHQACYGITKIPEGQWLCCTCNIGKRPDCVLCPNKGGAMKSTRTGHKWAHVSCALWIPEVSIGCVEKMEPITKISSIPSSRWALICVLCRERVGACIQCSVKTCKTAYHVTCAFKHGLEMRAIIEDENADDGVKLRSYCEKHSKSSKKSEKSVCSGSEDDDCKRKKRKDMTNEEKNQARAARLQEIESEFFKHVTVKDINNIHIEVDSDGLQYIYNYWKLKRKAGNNKPLLPPKSEDVDVLSHKREQADLEKMKMFVQLRQDLERVRNLCYMVSRREKLSRSFFRMREQTFHKQAAVLDSSNTLPTTVIQAVIEANHGPSIYDRLYSHNEAEDHTSDFDVILARIAGVKSPSHSGDELRSDVNGLFRDVKNNPYKKLYFNGSSKRRSASFYGSSHSSASSCDEKPKDNKENRLQTSSEEDKQVSKKKTPPPRKQINKPRKRAISRSKVDSSSEDEIKPRKKDLPSRSRLGQVASLLGDTGSESDDLLPMKSSRKSDNQKKTMSSIYSDSESSDVSMKNDDKSSNATNDSQSKMRTKAAVKEFSKPSSSKNATKSSPETKRKSKTEDTVNKKKDYVPSDLIVPQRQAAKKATENLKQSNRPKEQHPPSSQPEEQPSKPEEKITKEPKPKQKVKPNKEPTKEKESPKEKELQKEPEVKEKDKKKEIRSPVEQIPKEVDIPDLFTFVPQRQAAKKAAEHIKSGLGKPVPAAAVDASQSVEPPKKDTTEQVFKSKKDKEADVKTKSDLPKKDPEPSKPPAKIQETKRKSSVQSAQTSSSSSSSSSSSESGSTSSSDSEDEPEKEKPTNSQPRSESLLPAASPREAAKRSSHVEDRPFLDKAARSAAFSSASDSSDSSAPSTPRKSSPAASRKSSPAPRRKSSPTQTRKSSPAPARKSSPTSARKSSPTPTRKSSPIPTRKQSPTPTRKSSPTPTRKQSPTPTRKSSPTPTRKSSPTPTRKSSPTSIRKSSPTSTRKSSAPRKSSPPTSRRSSPTTQSKVVESTSDTVAPVRKGRKPSSDKKLPPSPPKREESSRRGRGRAARSRSSRTSQSSGDRVGDANVRSRDLSDDQRISVEGEQFKGIRKGKSELASSYSADRSTKETSESPAKLLSPIGKADKKLKDHSIEQAQKEIDLEREIRERKADKEKDGISQTKSTLDKLFETSFKKTDKPDHFSERKFKPEGKESAAKSSDHPLRTIEKQQNLVDTEFRPKTNLKTTEESRERSSEKHGKNTELVKAESLIKSPNKELKEQIERKHESDKTINKKSPSKVKTNDDRLSNSETKENRTESLRSPAKSLRISDEISVADKIVDDHLHAQKENELYHSSVSQPVIDSYNSTLDINKSALNDYDHETRNATKALEVLQSKSIFSPPQSQQKETDILDLVNFDNFGLSKEEMMKGPIPFPFNNSSIKEDTKEDSARETLNLVEKLRMCLTNKKSTSCDTDDATTSNDVESDKGENMEQVVPDNIVPPETIAKSETMKEEGIVLSNNINNFTQQFSKELDSVTSKPNEHHQQQQYEFTNCEAGGEIDTAKNISLQQPQELIHPAPIEGDERWVPPSENYPNMQSSENCSYLNDSQFMPQYPTTQQQHEQPTILNSLPPLPQLPPLKEQSLTPLHDPRISQTPLSHDCMPCPSPYPDIHPQAKWADSAVMPRTRSSPSSRSSSSSSSKREEDDTKMPPDVRMINHTSLDMASFISSQVPSYPPNPIDNFGTFPDPASQFIPVSLFPPPNINTQLPFPPTGSTGMYPPAFGAPFPTPHSIPPLTKPVEETIPYSSTCTATFTSSQHNMALTAAMVNIPTSTHQPDDQPAEVPHPASSSEVPALPPCSQPSVDEVMPSPVLNDATPTNNTLPSPSTSSKSAIGKKSPSKPTRTSARVTSQLMNKSPAKSPGKSPRQETSQRQSGPGRGRGDSKRGSGKMGASKTQISNRGRGRGRGRARGGHHNDFDFMGANTIHNKLVGTVYDLDFDDDISNDNMTDLKSMRERRKSIDIHDKRYDSFSSPRSPKFASPKNRFNADLRDLKPPSPIEDSRSKTDVSDNEPSIAFPDVTPVLPGPVDMRTYNSSITTSFDQPSYNEQNLLSAFASGTAGAQVHEDIDEDFEKELQSALTTKKLEEPPRPEIASNNSSNIKVSLSDSRNQLKVKIKGPIANYTSTVASLPPPVIDQVSNITANSATNNAIGSMPIGMSSGTSSLRRMRKKELLRQYQTQDMNMDDPSSNSSITATPAAPPVNRTIITIPKAVASMTSIPTKEDYRDYRTSADDLLETKHHKKSRAGGLSRELKQLELPMDDDLSDRRRSSVGSNASNSFDASNKRRGRPPRPTPTAPKLKIKIGNTNSIIPAEKPEEKNLRPPKKRLATLPKPSVEDLKRDSMKFRKLMMADLKVKKKKRDKNDRHRKKDRKKSGAEVQIISDESTSTKLIIRFGKPKKSASEVRTSGHSVNENVRTKDSNEPNLREKAEDKPMPKLTPIKLKISRCVEGSGYVMKPSTLSEPGSARTEEDQASQPGQPPPDSPQPPAEPDPLAGLPEALQQAPPPLPLNKDCEVR